MNISDLTTPAAIIDLERVERNCERMAARMKALGVRLRPHVKTHKTVEIARLQVRGHFGGVTVSTLAEARACIDAGFRDLTWAVPLALDRLGEIAELDARVDRFNVLVDHEATVQAIEEFARPRKLRFSVFLKVDCGYHRCGVDPRDPASVRLAQRLASSSSIDFRGVLTHAGHSYDAKNVAEIRAVAREERDESARFGELLRREGITCREVSVGSTPTMSVVDDLSGVSEARPGNYVFFDAFQTAIGSCSRADLAFSVLATVIGHYPAQNKIVLFAGALALSKDVGARHIDERCGYGLVANLDASEFFDELEIGSLSQEHAQVRSRTPLDFARFPLGAKLRVFANHSCLAAANFDRFHVVRGDEVVDEWRPARGW